VRRGGVAILDTGPIWELVLYDAVKQLGFASLKRDLQYFVRPEAYENCGDFLSTFAGRITSASVVVELYGRIQRTRPKMGHPPLWELVYEEFRNMRMKEEVVKLLDLDVNLVAKYGPTDASLLEIARRNRAQEPVILTVDGDFHARCKKEQISSELLIEVCNPLS
jgi:hypothetical protein